MLGGLTVPDTTVVRIRQEDAEYLRARFPGISSVGGQLSELIRDYKLSNAVTNSRNLVQFLKEGDDAIKSYDHHRRMTLLLECHKDDVPSSHSKWSPALAYIDAKFSMISAANALADAFRRFVEDVSDETK